MDSKPPTSRRFALRVLPAAGFALLVLAVYADPVATSKNFVGRDLVAYGLPLEKMVHDAWARGRVPVWSEGLSGGRPLFANPNSGTLYPLRPLLSRLPFPLAMRLFPVFQWVLAGVGMILLLRALSVSSAAAWVGAATYVFSGVIVSQIFYVPFQPATAFHPWILWALVRPRGGVARRAVLLGVLYGLLLLLGDVFAVSIALLASLLWIVFEDGGGQRRRRFAALALGLGIGALLGAPQIVATALLAPETHRAVTGIRLREVLAFTLSPWRLLELVVPYPFGDFWTLDDAEAWGSPVFRGFVVTLYSGAFAVVGLVALRRSGARGARFSRALLSAGILLAVAFRFLPSSWGERTSWIPLRFPEKFAVAIALSLAVAAGLAFDRFRAPIRRPTWILGVGILLAVLALAARSLPAQAGEAAASAVGAPPGAAGQAGRQLPGALAEAGLLWVATLVALELVRHPGRARIASGVALLTAVPIAANRRIAHTESESRIFPPTAFGRAIAGKDPEDAYRAIDLGVYRPFSLLALAAQRGDLYLTQAKRNDWAWATQALWHRGTVFNLDPDRGDFSRLESLRRFSAREASRGGGAPFFEAASVRFAIRYRDQEPLPGFLRFGGTRFATGTRIRPRSRICGCSRAGGRSPTLSPLCRRCRGFPAARSFSRRIAARAARRGAASYKSRRRARSG